ncbi:MAG: DUF6876 family protein [Cyanobacteriota bacterium]
MSDIIKENLELYRKSSTSLLEKEVIDLVFESSETYSELKNFILHVVENGLDSGIVPKLTSVSFCIEFTDRHYMKIEELLVEYEQEYKQAYVLPKDTLTKVSLAYFGFLTSFQNILSMITIQSLKSLQANEKDPRIEIRKKIESEIRSFCGTDKWYQLYPNVLATDGIKFIFDTAQAYWIGDIVFSIQSYPKVKSEVFQFYELLVDLESSTGEIKVTDGNENIIYSQKIQYTDFPLPKFSFYYTNDVILLPSEY